MSESADSSLEPMAAGIEHHIQVLATRAFIRELSIDRSSVVMYLQGVARDKQEIALIHALEVGVNELLARRARFRRGNGQ